MSSSPDPHAIRVPVMVVTVAHPDDESFGCGSVIAAAASRGWRVVVCCASRGEAGEDASRSLPTPEALAMAREIEFRSASAVLGAAAVEVFDFADSGWDGEPPEHSLVVDCADLSATVAEAFTRHRPDVVVTMDPAGSDGHRDHAAIGEATTTAFGRVVDWPASLYHWCLPRSLMDRWAREIAAEDPASVYLETELGRDDHDITTIIDASDALDARWRAIDLHTTQISPYAGISAELAEAFVGRDHLIRVEPPWTGGGDVPLKMIFSCPPESPDTSGAPHTTYCPSRQQRDLGRT